MSLLVILAQNVTELCTFMSVAPVLRTFVEYLIAFCSPLEKASDVISDRFMRPIVYDKLVKFCNPRLIRSREIPPETVGDSVFEFFP